MRILILFLFFIFALNALAVSPLRSVALPMFQNGDRSFVPHATLGPVCSSIRALKEEPACNPALLGEDFQEDSEAPSHLVPGHVFGANIFFGNDYSTLYKNRDLIRGGDKMQLAENLLGETRPIQFQGSTMVWWRSERMSLSYQPLRVTYFSDVRNQSYPDLSIHGMQEQSVQGQVGGFLDENWRAGVQLRYLERKFVDEQFNVFSALPHLEDYFKVKNQRAFFVEPGVAYELNETRELREWKPLLTLNVSQMGWLDQSYDEVPVTPIVDSGFSVSPPIALGEWELGLNYRYTTYVSTERKFRFGTLYHLHWLQLQAGFDADEWSLGFQANFHGLGAGLMFRRVEIPRFEGDRDFEDSTTFEFRYTL